MPNVEEMVNKQNSAEAVDFIFKEVFKTMKMFQIRTY